MARFFKEVGRRLHLVGPEEASSAHHVSGSHVGDHKHLYKHHHHHHHHTDHHHHLNGAIRSDTEEEPGAGGGGGSRTIVPQHQIAEYRQLAEKSWNFLWHCLNVPESDWKQEAGKSRQEDGLVSSQHIKEYGKIFKLEGEVEMEAQSLWKEMIHNINTAPTWNPTLVECNTVQVIDDCTDISYNIAAGIGGIVSSRDFVNVRHWGTKQGVYLSAGHGVTHPDRPPVKKHVRGYNGPGGWAFKPMENEPNKCIFIWVMNLELKGWMPQRLVDQAMTTVLQDYLKYLRRHVAEMHQTP